MSGKYVPPHLRERGNSASSASFSVAPPPPPVRPPSAGWPARAPQQSEKRLRKPSTKESVAFTARIKASRSAEDAIRVILDIEETSGCLPNAFQYSAAISKCAKEKQLGEALRLLKRMISQGVEPDAMVFAAAIGACTKVAKYKIAILLLDEMEEKHGVKPSLQCFKNSIIACEKAAEWKEAVKLLSRMAETGIAPDVVCYSSVISACGKCAEWEKALDFLNEMKEVGIQPNVISYNSAISACDKGAANPEPAKHVSVQMNRMSAQDREKMKGMSAQDKEDMRKCGQADVALLLLDEMKAEGIRPDVYSYSSAISACGKGGSKFTDTALSLFYEMKEQGIRPDNYCYSSAIAACGKGGEKYVDTALSLWAEMKAEGIRPNVYSYSSAIAAFGEGGAKYTDNALSLLAKMKAEGSRPSVVSYDSAITACEKGGAKYTDTALSLFNEMKEAGLKPNDVTYRVITKACFNSSRYSEALVKAREAADLGVKINGQLMCIDMSTEKGLPMWDLRDLTEATACMLLSDALLNLVAGNDGPAQKIQDVKVITRNGQVLREKVPAFLNDVAGLDVATIEGNEGRFFITASSLEKWVASGAFNKFQSLFQEKRAAPEKPQGEVDDDGFTAVAPRKGRRGRR